MRKHVLVRIVFLSILCLAASPSVLCADTLTFGADSIDELINAGVQFEGDLEYEAMSGLGWEIVNSGDARGNPPSALATYFNGSVADQTVGDQVAIRYTDGRLFQFLSVETRANSNPLTSALITISGTNNGQLVGSIDPTPTSLYTANAGFDGAIDTLLVTLASRGVNAFWLDNVVVTAIPEPSTFASLGMVLLSLALRRPSCLSRS